MNRGDAPHIFLRSALYADGFEKVELTIPVNALRLAGASVDIVPRALGATWLDQEVVHDDNWISSRGPQDMVPFVKATTRLCSPASRRRSWSRR